MHARVWSIAIARMLRARNCNFYDETRTMIVTVCACLDILLLLLAIRRRCRVHRCRILQLRWNGMERESTQCLRQRRNRRSIPRRVVVQLEQRYREQLHIRRDGELRALLEENEEDLLVLLRLGDVGRNVGVLFKRGERSSE
jgi:hypothetical protein